MAVSFAKYHGLGNDFILIDNRSCNAPILSPEAAMRWCDRHFGIGADGIIFLLPDARMRIFNSDGSEPEMCGNGIRCLAKFMADRGIPPSQDETFPHPYYRITTGAGTIVPQLAPDGQVIVDMGEPRLAAGDIPTTLGDRDSNAVNVPLEVAGQTWQVTTVSMGNPHCVLFVPDVAAIPLATLGPQFEHHPAFPQRTNTEFAQVIRPNYVKMRVWERGAGATLACGTGACATVVAGVLTGRCDRACTVELPGGSLRVEWSAQTNRLAMTGPAVCIFTGTVENL